MKAIVDWASEHARMVIALIALSIAAGTLAYTGLPKEGEPDIDIPALFVSVPFPGISAEDSEKLIVKPLENELRDLDGLDKMNSTAAEGYGIVVMEFEFGWDKQATIAEVRDRVNNAQADWPAGAEQYSIDEINFSEFPILILSLSGDLPERTLLRVADDLKTEIESLGQVLEAPLAGHRDEMLEVLIDPLQLEAYNVTAGELINVVVNNNQLVAAGEIESGSGAYSVKIPSSFDSPQDVYDLPVKVNGDSVITLGDLTDIRLTFEDREGTARYNGESTVAIQVVKRKGQNLIGTVASVKEVVASHTADWPTELSESITISYSMDQSIVVDSMVSQLEAAVLTAIGLVMIVVLASLGIRSALLVGFAIPTSFLLCFAALAVVGITISNIVMFALILAVGMLVDGAIVVVEYADKEINRGVGPMQAYVAAAKRMFWPVISSTATTLCAFLPMLFWPGIPGEFMGNLPRTLIFVLSASLIVALVYLPVVGGVSGRISRVLENSANTIRARWNIIFRLALLILAAAALFYGLFSVVLTPGFGAKATGAAAFIFGAMAFSVAATSLRKAKEPEVKRAGYRRSLFGWFIHMIAGNPIMPLVAIAATIGFVMSTFSYFGQNSKGVEFFVETDPEQAIVFVRARGNLSLSEKDRLVQQVEAQLLDFDEIQSVFAFAGAGGINQNTGGANAPNDTVGQIQIELVDYTERRPGKEILKDVDAAINTVPGIQADILEIARGPAQGKPINIRLTSDNWQDLQDATGIVRSFLDDQPNLANQEDTRPLPGIDWQIDVDVEQAGRYGADVATVGAMVQLITRGILLDTMQVDSSDEEIEIRVRYPEQDRVLSTLDTMRVRTSEGLVPLTNFITRKPVPKLATISRFNQERNLLVRSDVIEGANANAEIARIGAWLGMHDALPNDITSAALPEWLDTARTDETAPEFEALLAFTDTYIPAEAEGDAPAVRDTAEAILSGDLDTQIIATLDKLILSTTEQLPKTVAYEFAGDQAEQAESQAFLGKAFIGALGLMFVILLAQFNSFYNSVIVLIAVILSVTGVLIGMLVMDQTFSIIMTGTGIVALAGIVVNNNIVLIDTYQDYARFMSRTEAIVRTAEARIRPVLLTTITTMAGLTPMMLGISVDFANGGYTVDAPTSLWWKSLATAVVFGLGLATILTLVITPALLALRVWIVRLSLAALARLGGRNTPRWQDRMLRKIAKRAEPEDIDWLQKNRPAPVMDVDAAPQAAE